MKFIFELPLKQTHLTAFVHSFQAPVLLQYLDNSLADLGPQAQIFDGKELSVLPGLHDISRRSQAQPLQSVKGRPYLSCFSQEA